MYIGCKIVSILAIGCNKRFAHFITFGGYEFTCRISKKTYDHLKESGVLTGQYLRWHKNER